MRYRDSFIIPRERVRKRYGRLVGITSLSPLWKISEKEKFVFDRVFLDSVVTNEHNRDVVTLSKANYVTKSFLLIIIYYILLKKNIFTRIRVGTKTFIFINVSHNCWTCNYNINGIMSWYRGMRSVFPSRCPSQSRGFSRQTSNCARLSGLGRIYKNEADVYGFRRLHRKPDPGCAHITVLGGTGYEKVSFVPRILNTSYL